MKFTQFDVFAVAFLMAGCSGSAPSPPPLETQFIKVLSDADQRYSESKSNKIAQSKIFPERSAAICQLFGDNVTVADWIGEVAVVQSWGKKANLTVKIGDGFFFRPRLHSGYGESMIAPSSPLFAKIEHLRRGDRVRFAGNFLSGAKIGCLRESSITEIGSIIEPEFLFNFEHVDPI